MARKLAIVGLAIGLAAIGLAVLANLTVMAGDPVGTGFTYQGYLTNDGSEANGQYDFEFKLYDAATDGSRIGSAVTETDVTVTDGLFTVKLDFGSAAFTGEARWLEIGVKAEDETGYTAILPRTALTPAPYALHAADAWTLNGNAGTTPGTHLLGTTDDVSLTLVVNGSPALRLEYAEVGNTAVPNVIAGSNDNSVVAGVAGATVTGGRENTVSGSTTKYATVGGGSSNDAMGFATTVGGGYGNAAGADYATVGGGQFNQATDKRSTVSGGGYNAVTDIYAAVGGGGWNTASARFSTVGGGQSNTAGAWHATVSGGGDNQVNADYATVSGGKENNVSAGYATVGGGSLNQVGANATYATVGGGYDNEATGNSATIPGGKEAKASLWGQMAYAAGHFEALGDAQASLYVLRNVTGGSWAATQSLALDGGSKYLTLSDTRTLTFDALIVARSSGGDSAGYRAEGVIENVSGSTSLIGTPTVTTLGKDIEAWDVSITVDDTEDALMIKVTGDDTTEVRWVATVRTTEVAW